MRSHGATAGGRTMNDVARQRPDTCPQTADGRGLDQFRVLTLNTHKGLAAWNRRYVLSELRDAARQTGADVVFLQEVIGEKRRARHTGYPQYEFLADTLWPQFAYGRNAVSTGGHHGNAVLSRFPISHWKNHDASVGGEKRGLLHCVLAHAEVPIHAICVHLGLSESHRRLQLDALCRLIRSEVGADEPLIVAGDFNDWRGRADGLVHDCGLRSAFAYEKRGSPRTFPARLPLLRLDRIYVRGMTVHSAAVLAALPWPHLSDHLPLFAEVSP